MIAAMKAIQGIVAFVDVLGYQNFIDNNDVGKAVEVLTKVFKGLKEAAVKEYSEKWTSSAAPKRRFEDVVIQTLSDSIIFYLETPERAIRVGDWITFFQLVRVTQRRLFDNGFPSRGAVASGDYYCSAGFLVGRPFMDAYRLTQSLEFAGVVLTPDTFTHIKEDFSGQKCDLRHYPGGVDFLVPMKGNREEKLFCLCPLRRREIGTSILNDIAGLVHGSFWYHQKDVPASVDAKINNTIKFWRYWICRRLEQSREG
jgi:hypothetical protein